MAKRRKPLSWGAIIVIALVSTWYYATEVDRSDPVLAGESLTEANVVVADYEVLEACTLIESRRNDGDSFMVKHAEGETEFRLYYVDAPESKYKEYANGENNGKRIDDQGRYFGGLARTETTALGMKAKEFAIDLLQQAPFRVVTKWENVYGPQRRYAFVLVRYQGKQVFLHEVLVGQGLARIHTKPATLPTGRSASKQRKKLQGLEASAKNAQLGGWQK